MIPKNASVLVQDTILPHLSHRDYIYNLYNFKDNYQNVDYIILNFKHNTWPLSPEDYKNQLRVLLNTEKNYGLVFSKGGWVLFQKSAEDKCKPSEELLNFIE